MDLLLDVNIVLDVCAVRPGFALDSIAAVQRCQSQGGKLWLYTGSVQTMEYNLAREMQRIALAKGSPVSKAHIAQKSRQSLKSFAADKQWLAALPDQGNVFDSLDPEDEQLIKALARFAPASIKLLTRDALLCQRYPALTITPQEYLQTPPKRKAIEFCDLAAQQDRIRPALEHNIHRVLHHGQYILGHEVAELEEKLATYTGSKYCITCANGTDALQIAQMALGIGPGDEVITQALPILRVLKLQYCLAQNRFMWTLTRKPTTLIQPCWKSPLPHAPKPSSRPAFTDSVPTWTLLTPLQPNTASR